MKFRQRRQCTIQITVVFETGSNVLFYLFCFSTFELYSLELSFNCPKIFEQFENTYPPPTFIPLRHHPYKLLRILKFGAKEMKIINEKQN